MRPRQPRKGTQNTHTINQHKRPMAHDALSRWRYALFFFHSLFDIRMLAIRRRPRPRRRAVSGIPRKDESVTRADTADGNRAVTAATLDRPALARPASQNRSRRDVVPEPRPAHLVLLNCLAACLTGGPHADTRPYLHLRGQQSKYVRNAIARSGGREDDGESTSVRHGCTAPRTHRSVHIVKHVRGERLDRSSLGTDRRRALRIGTVAWSGPAPY